MQRKLNHVSHLAFWLAVSAVAFLPACDGARNGEPVVHSRSTTDATTTQATLWVNGLSCPLCSNNLDKQLHKFGGVRKVEVDLGTGKVEVQMVRDQQPSKAQLTRAVEESGFTLVRMELPEPGS